MAFARRCAVAGDGAKAPAQKVAYFRIFSREKGGKSAKKSGKDAKKCGKLAPESSLFKWLRQNHRKKL